MFVYKLDDNSSAQVWLWDRDLNSDKGFWRTVKEGYTRDIHGRTYVFSFGKNFLPQWISRETIIRRDRKARNLK
jgi:hypothetical protein